MFRSLLQHQGNPRWSRMDASSESQIGLAVKYQIAFQVWQFHVNSYWQRNSYFAAFQSVALAAAWRIVGYRSAIVLCAAGILLVLVWYMNNLIIGSYIRSWWGTIEALEATDSGFPLVKDNERQCVRSGMRRILFVCYSTVMSCIP